jgi:membrane-associated protease RseP (regulator of RpoE activity)
VIYQPADQLPGFSQWLGPATIRQVWGDPALLSLGLAFSIPTMLILLSHELGHYLACRRYRIPATWPHFLPVPILLGTVGAFIRIKAPIRTKRELFDVGVAGPIAGFVVTLPFLVYGIWRSTPVEVQAAEPFSTNLVLYLPGKSLLFGILQHVAHGAATPDTVLDLHPFAFAAWVGLLVTALNLLPFGQLDGGHILYAAIGQAQRKLALPLWGLLIAGGFYWPGWFLWSFIVLLMRLRHPPVRDERVPLDRRRRGLALVALAIFILAFMPIPLDMIWVQP